uniref:DAO domain-containing protein n=1 Tax=Enterobius vermicularis TaxID=51028 RepID=A0A0N4VIN9_ENTVE
LFNCCASALSADVVVCGGGIAGTSVAYHLAERGKKVFLFERDRIGSGGATGLAAGQVTAPMHWQDPTKQYMAKRSIDLYHEIASASNFRKILLDSEISLRRMYSRSILYNEGAELVDDASEMLYRWPFLRTDDIKLALVSPNDLFLDPVGLCNAFAERAKEMGTLTADALLGVKIFENSSVQEVIVGEDNRIKCVDTGAGLIETANFVDAAGIWCGHIPVRNLSTTTFRIAVYPAMYTYLNTQKIPSMNVSDQTPIFTHVDDKIFIKPTAGNTYCGGFSEEQAKPLSLPDENDFKWTIPPPDWDAFYPSLSKLLSRCECLGSVGHGNLVGGPEAYTSDKNPVVGETAQVDGYYVAGGLSGQGLALAGGMGEALADVICNKVPKVDMSRMEVTRFIPLHSSPQYLLERVPEVAGMLFTNSYEYHQFRTARNLRTAPIFQLLKNKGAVFGEIMSYERPLWYTKQSDRDNFYKGQYKLIGKPEWFDRVEKEYEACRERVGLIDMSSFSKFDIFGPDVVELLQRLCSADVDEPVGSTVYSGMQNQNGGYVTDCTLSRLSHNHYFVVAPTYQQLRLQRWVNKWINEWKYKATCQDVTGLYTALDIVGPASRYLMQDVTGYPMTSSNFPTFRVKEMNIGIATGIRVISVSHCGELGCVIYIPSEVAQNVYERLVDSGEEYSLKHVGYYALRQLRIEKFYVYWGQDIGPLVTPLECGRAFRVNFSKDFIGREALLRQKETGIRKRFVQVLVGNHDLEIDPWPQGGEVIFRNGVPAGRTTSAAYGFTLECQVCIGYIENQDSYLTADYINRADYEIEIAGKRFPVQVNLHSPTLPMISSEHPMHYRPTQ